MLRQRKIRCCRAAGKPAVRAVRSIDNWPNLQTADFAAVRNLNLRARYQADSRPPNGQHARNYDERDTRQRYVVGSLRKKQCAPDKGEAAVSEVERANR